VVLILAEDAGNVPTDAYDERIDLPGGLGDLSVLPAAAVFQRIAYETALLLGRDVDKPRNLAKSVTVE
jgi:glucosamine--fructose-6-phosphate aminotransferase (isomerizing)